MAEEFGIFLHCLVAAWFGGSFEVSAEIGTLNEDPSTQQFHGSVFRVSRVLESSSLCVSLFLSF